MAGMRSILAVVLLAMPVPAQAQWWIRVDSRECAVPGAALDVAGAGGFRASLVPVADTALTGRPDVSSLRSHAARRDRRMTNRRTFLRVAAGWLLGRTRVARAQPPTMPMVAFVRSSSIETVGHLVAGFRQGLKETGYVEGQNVALEFRSADDHHERLPAIIAQQRARRLLDRVDDLFFGSGSEGRQS